MILQSLCCQGNRAPHGQRQWMWFCPTEGCRSSFSLSASSALPHGWGRRRPPKPDQQRKLRRRPQPCGNPLGADREDELVLPGGAARRAGFHPEQRIWWRSSASASGDLAGAQGRFGSALTPIENDWGLLGVCVVDLEACECCGPGSSSARMVQNPRPHPAKGAGWGRGFCTTPPILFLSCISGGFAAGAVELNR